MTRKAAGDTSITSSGSVPAQDGHSQRPRRARNPQATREHILEYARTLLAEDGIEGLSVSAVAAAAGVNRGTAYMHFDTRERLIEQTIASVSEILLRSIYGDNANPDDTDVARIDVSDLTEGLADFAMENPDLCRVWFLQVLSSPTPASDPFWRKYVRSLQRFAQTDLAKPGVDAEVLSIIVLAGTFLWPVWAHAATLTAEERREASARYSRELLRLSLHGSLVAERLPDVTGRLNALSSR
jgi:AcrR family transcriptional regulator